MASQTTTISTSADVKGGIVTMLKVAIFLIVMEQFGAVVFGFFYGMTVIRPVQALLTSWHVTTDTVSAVRILSSLSVAPLIYAINAVLSPVVGWWIGSRVAKPSQGSVLWGSLGLYILLSLIVGIVTGGFSTQMSTGQGWGMVAFGMILLAVFDLFFMGVGLLLARSFSGKKAANPEVF